MRKIKEILNNINIEYDNLPLPEKETVIFLDIETTGLSSRNSFIYMIGLSYYENGGFVFEGLMADSASEEHIILKEFVKKIASYTTLIHFNGNRFDIPFIKDRCEANGIIIDLNRFDGIDLYKRLTPYKHLFRLSNCKQKTLEIFMGVTRKDEYSGGELINVYKEYVVSHSEELYYLLYQHNRDDLAGMLEILPMLNYGNIFTQAVKVNRVSANIYEDYFGEKKRELLIEFTLNSTIPQHISFNAGDVYGSFKGDKGILKVPVYHEEMKLYYDNYKDYYYLPAEDQAIHKSVAIYVDKNFRKQATAKTCYTKLDAEFLPQWDIIVSPFFKRDYDSKLLFFQLNDDIKQDKELFSRYTSHLLQMIANFK